MPGSKAKLSGRLISPVSHQLAGLILFGTHRAHRKPMANLASVPNYALPDGATGRRVSRP
jgi:hypothetical protein